MQAVLYLFALKFLGRSEVENMEVLKMTYFAKMMIDEGIVKGESRGDIKRLFRQISRKLNKGKTPEAIAEDLEEELWAVQKICDFIKAHENKSEEELVLMYLEEAA